MSESSEVRTLAAQDKEISPGMRIQRYLPHPELPAIGHFVFFDHAADLAFTAGQGVDVRPHPHIGLSTLSYLLTGRMHHRDSAGNDVIIEPGDVLLMTSGHGIVHSERTPADDRLGPHKLHLLQLWLALPQAHEAEEPRVVHAVAGQLPVAELQPGLHARLALGEFAGLRSPVTTYGESLLLDLRADGSGIWCFSSADADLALFIVNGQVLVEQQAHSGPALVLLPRRESLELRYTAGSRFVLLGGQALDGPRIVWWNLVASRPELIDAAKERWVRREFPLVPGDEQEFIPLPEEPKAGNS
ncbi:MAG: pirin family protein [Candidatus Sericytochromatia bacterium]